MGIINIFIYSNTLYFMKNILEELREKVDNPQKIKKMIFENEELKRKLINDSDFLKGSKYDEINLGYKYLRVGGSYDNYKCPYCGEVRKLNASVLANTCGSKECMGKCQHDTKLKMHENMNEVTKNNIREKMKKTCLKRYGVEYVTQSNLMKEKTYETKKERYGNPFFTNQEKREKTNILKYGGTAPLCSEEVKEKVAQTNINRYGVKNVFQCEDIKNTIKNTNVEKYGVEYPMMSKEIQNKVNYSEAVFKQIISKKKNGTLHTSSHEKQIYEWLVEEFGVVEKQYMDERYKNPNTNLKFKCDFYLPEYDMFIEYQGTYHHGKEPFDEKNIQHQNILKEWKERSLKHVNSDYVEAINVWTKKDPLKRGIANNNKLNFLEIWNNNGKCPSKETVIKLIKERINNYYGRNI